MSKSLFQTNLSLFLRTYNAESLKKLKEERLETSSENINADIADDYIHLFFSPGAGQYYLIYNILKYTADTAGDVPTAERMLESLLDGMGLEDSEIHGLAEILLSKAE